MRDILRCQDAAAVANADAIRSKECVLRSSGAIRDENVAMRATSSCGDTEGRRWQRSRNRRDSLERLCAMECDMLSSRYPRCQ